eukprot:TRINITY_DN31892_c0_g1_i1.p1 TRINITY_DN31892_c0_g1~~TRINITY_DN31892_c0_g1_i1.p1  ORF type:complete len:969 (-),score=122.72 TRINITY_DN31892_c0_g1_i1:116-2983(-)
MARPSRRGGLAAVSAPASVAGTVDAARMARTQTPSAALRVSATRTSPPRGVTTVVAPQPASASRPNSSHSSQRAAASKAVGGGASEAVAAKVDAATATFQKMLATLQSRHGRGAAVLRGAFGVDGGGAANRDSDRDRRSNNSGRNFASRQCCAHPIGVVSNAMGRPGLGERRIRGSVIESVIAAAGPSPDAEMNASAAAGVEAVEAEATKVAASIIARNWRRAQSRRLSRAWSLGRAVARGRLQAWWRMCLAHRQMLLLRRATVTLQRWARAMAARRRLRQRLLCRHTSAALFLQRWWRMTAPWRTSREVRMAWLHSALRRGCRRRGDLSRMFESKSAAGVWRQAMASWQPCPVRTVSTSPSARCFSARSSSSRYAVRSLTPQRGGRPPQPCDGEFPGRRVGGPAPALGPSSKSSMACVTSAASALTTPGSHGGSPGSGHAALRRIVGDGVVTSCGDTGCRDIGPCDQTSRVGRGSGAGAGLGDAGHGHRGGGSGSLRRLGSSGSRALVGRGVLRVSAKSTVPPVCSTRTTGGRPAPGTAATIVAALLNGLVRLQRWWLRLSMRRRLLTGLHAWAAPRMAARIRLQAWWRMRSARFVLDRRRCECHHAALRLQRAWRCCLARRRRQRDALACTPEVFVAISSLEALSGVRSATDALGHERVGVCPDGTRRRIRPAAPTAPAVSATKSAAGNIVRRKCRPDARGAAGGGQQQTAASRASARNAANARNVASRSVCPGAVAGPVVRANAAEVLAKSVLDAGLREGLLVGPVLSDSEDDEEPRQGDHMLFTVKALRATLGVPSFQVFNVAASAQAAVYEAVRSALGGVQTEERLLWHGTSWRSVPNILKAGFNRAYAGRHGTKFGVGTYFSADPTYALRFCDRPTAEREPRALLLVRVRIGRFTRGSSGMVEPPLLQDAQGGGVGERFDSTVDDCECPRIFCVFRDFQALPVALAVLD